MEDCKIGAMYVAFGRFYASMALVSAATLRAHNPGIEIALVTNVEMTLDDLQKVGFPIDFLSLVKAETAENRNVKTSLEQFSPFDKTLFLDCDTYVVGNLSDFSRYLDYFDVFLRLNPERQSRNAKAEIRLLDGQFLVGELPHWNSGVMGFVRNPRTVRFFDRWGKAFQAIGAPYDQPALVEAIFLSGIKLLSVDSRWNYIPYSRRQRAPRGVKIVHYTDRVSYRLEKAILNVYNKMGWNVREGLRTVQARRRARFHKSGLLGALALRWSWTLEMILKRKETLDFRLPL